MEAGPLRAVFNVNPRFNPTAPVQRVGMGIAAGLKEDGMGITRALRAALPMLHGTRGVEAQTLAMQVGTIGTTAAMGPTTAQVEIMHGMGEETLAEIGEGQASTMQVEGAGTRAVRPAVVKGLPLIGEPKPTAASSQATRSSAQSRRDCSSMCSYLSLRQVEVCWWPPVLDRCKSTGAV